jgi:retron-type reverse transcriptase
MLDFLENNSLISKFQYGFLPKCSCEKQLLCRISDWKTSQKAKKPVDVIYIDFKQAYDTVDHTVLIHKLSKLGISDYLLTWIFEYLNNREHYVRIGSECSNKQKINRGVPQGGSLSPLLFIIFVNDLPLIIKHSKIYMYADDLVLYREVET